MPPKDTTGQNNEFLNALQERLLGRSGAVSSEPSGVDRLINDAISGLESSRTTTEAGIKAKYERERIDTQDLGNRIYTTEVEGSRGFARNTAVLKQITDSTTKSLRDLDLREQEALAVGNNQVASQIASLKLEKIKFQSDAEQKTFQNLLAGAGLQMQKNQLDLQTRNQNFQERSAIANIGLNYGVEVKDGDTIETVVARAWPTADKMQKLELQRIQADIRRINAEAQKAIDGDPVVEDDPLSIDALAIAFNRVGGEVLVGIEDNNILARVINRAAEFEAEETKNEILGFTGSKEEALNIFVRGSNAKNPVRNMKWIEEEYARRAKEKKANKGGGNIFSGLGQVNFFDQQRRQSEDRRAKAQANPYKSPLQRLLGL